MTSPEPTVGGARTGSACHRPVLGPPAPIEALPPRIAAKIRLDAATGCWLWTGSLNSEGYGRVVGVKPRCTACGRGAPVQFAHRVVYELLVGPIPEGQQLDHVKARGCEYRHCVNPAHLEPVTQRVNILRGSGPTAINAQKTHCPKGHEYTPENTWIAAKGSRNCRACKRDRDRRRQRGPSRRGVGAPKVHNANTYRDWGCRCAECRAAKSAQKKAAS